MKLKKLILILFVGLITGCVSPGINKRVEGFIGEPKNTVFEELGNPISCEIIDDSEYCIYTVKELGPSYSYSSGVGTYILFPMPYFSIDRINNEWIHCYLLEFGKDKILERVDHKIVELEMGDYPDKICYGMFGVPLSIPK